MKRAILATLIIAAMLVGQAAQFFTQSVPAAEADTGTTISDLELATHWAPVWYQDTDSSDYDADYITSFDFDGDWDATNNWERQPYFSLKAYIYYWVVETETHWFIGYADFHPRDWEDWPDLGLFSHENDMEGCLLVIRKDQGLTTYGTFETMLTQAHGDFKTYDFGHTIFDIRDHQVRPCVYVESKGHGVHGKKSHAYHAPNPLPVGPEWVPIPGSWEEDELFPGPHDIIPDGDGIIYYPDDNLEEDLAQEPQEYHNVTHELVSYELKPIDELWDRRCDSSVFSTFATFGGDITPGIDSMIPDAANAPWGWKDGDEHPAPEFFINPAYLSNESSPKYLYRSYYEPNPRITYSKLPSEDGTYYVGETIEAEFTIENSEPPVGHILPETGTFMSSMPLHFDVVTIGGRDEEDVVQDFKPKPTVRLDPSKSYTYKGTFTPPKPGKYRFFCAYQMIRKEPNDWNLHIRTKAGVEGITEITVLAGTPKFLTLPFEGVDVNIVAGWYRTNGDYHGGIDYALERGTPVLAAADGIAMASCQPPCSGSPDVYGNFVLIKHGNGYSTLYAHLDSIAEGIKVYPPDQRWNQQFDSWTPVSQGDIIGYVGDAGVSPYHLHFETANNAVGDYTGHINNRVDPYDIYNRPSYYPPSGSDYTSCGPDRLWTTDPPSVPLTTDTEKPTISISSPYDGQPFITSTITVRGTAWDNVKVNKVEVKVGSGDWQTASTTTSWSQWTKQITLSPGLNTIYAKATDSSGRTKETSVTVPYSPPLPPTIAYEPTTIRFPNAIKGGSDPPDQTLSIRNSGGGTLSWLVRDDATWLTLEPPSGSCTVEIDNVTVSARISGMSVGSHDAIITISATGASSETVPVTLTIDPYESLTPPTLYEPSVSGANYTISWSEVSGASSYLLQEDTNSSFSPNPTEYRLIQTRKYFEGKSNGTYYYRVKALKDSGGSDWSEETKSVTVSEDYSPGEITNMWPQDGAADQPLTVTLRWDASHPGWEGLSYDVFLMPFYSDTLYMAYIVSSAQTENTYIATNLEYDTPYTWGVRAWDETGDNRTSSICHFTTVADVSGPHDCSIRINNDAATTDTYGVTLYLSASDDESGVQYMKFSNDGQNWTSWKWYSPRYPWNIADYHYGGKTGQTTYTVYAQFKDEQGNETPIPSRDTIEKLIATPGNIILNGVYYETIRDAVAAAQAGDTIYLTEGTYTIWGEPNPPRYPSTSVGIVLKPGVTLMGAGADRTKIVLETYLYTIIDADNSRIEGLTIVMADPNGVRYAVLMESDSSEIRNCIIQSTYDGVDIRGNNNRLSNNLIKDSETAINISLGTNSQIYNNTIVYNTGNGILSYDSTAQIRNNIIAYNSEWGVYVQDSTDFRNNDVFDNFRNYASDGWLSDQTGVNGNISADPLIPDYHLNPGSPAIDAGTDVGIPFNGSAPDMGAFEYGATGTLRVVSNVDEASFTICGPQDYSGGGKVWPVSDAPIGLYSITFEPIFQHYTPQYETKTLVSNQTIEFDGTYKEDTIPPSGTISVNFGEYATGDNMVTITLSFTDAIAGLGFGAQMMFSNDSASWSSPEPFSTLKQDWDLTAYGGNSDSGSKTVYVKVSDALGNWPTEPITDTMLYVPDRQILEVPTEYRTIQAAIDAAQAGDMVHVLPGDYQENVVLKDGVRLQGSGPGVTSLNRETTDTPGITAANNSMIDGFTINKEPWMGYIGILCQDASPIISNNIIRAARGVEIKGASEPIIRNNVFKECSALAIFIVGETSAVIENNTIVGNDEGIYLTSATPNTRVYVTNNIVANNQGCGITDTNTADTAHKHIFSSFNLFWQNAEGNLGGTNKDKISGPGDMEGDPLFADPGNGDFTLQDDSPAINSGHPEDRYNDFDGTRNDRGAYGGLTVNTPPSADFSLNFYQGSLGTTFSFDASISRDRESEDDELYIRWDWDGDGQYDTDFSMEKTATHQYETLGMKTINLQVRDKGGFISVAAKQVVILNQSPGTPYEPSPENDSVSVAVGVALSWSCEDPDLGDTVTYDVYLGTGSDIGLELVSPSQTTATYTPTPPELLQHEETYYWEVVATDSHGASVSSPVWSFSTELEPVPDSPSALEAETVSTSQIDLAWIDNSNNELGFRIERKIGAEGSYTQLCTVAAEVTSFSDTGLIEGLSYYYRVCAYNSSGDSGYSSEASAALWIQPVASFTLSPEKFLIGQTGQTISFNASSSFDQDGNIVSYEWDFGDENGDSGEIVEHAYSDAGDYAVTLTVVDDDGVIDMTAVTITIVKRGDATSDGEVNALDIVEVERIILGLDDLSPGADANGDGQVNALDITRIEELIAMPG